MEHNIKVDLTLSTICSSGFALAVLNLWVLMKGS